MSCPNTPPCGHSSFLHTLDDLEGVEGIDDVDDLEADADLDRPPPRCCMLGCPCGAETLLGVVPAPRAPHDGRGMDMPSGCPRDGLEPVTPASSPAGIVEAP